jgi:hypothetical protein
MRKSTKAQHSPREKQQKIVPPEVPEHEKVSFEKAVKSMPFLREVNAAEEFVLANGERVKSLLELQYKLVDMAEVVFESHVNEWKNDFATWVYHAIGDKTLAEQLGPLKTKLANLNAIKNRVREHAYQVVTVGRH